VRSELLLQRMRPRRALGRVDGFPQVCDLWVHESHFL
jgi:hypothetical protein